MKLNLSPLALIVYTDNLPEGTGGKAAGPVVLIRPKYTCDEGIHRHELEHVRQWWVVGVPAALLVALWNPYFAPAGLIIAHHLLYWFVRRYRLWAEVRAYRKQMEYPACDGLNMPLELGAWRLSQPRYDLGITAEQAAVELGR